MKEKQTHKNLVFKSFCLRRITKWDQISVVFFYPANQYFSWNENLTKNLWTVSISSLELKVEIIEIFFQNISLTLCIPDENINRITLHIRQKATEK